MEELLEINKNRIKNSIILIGIFSIVLCFFYFRPTCIFKEMFQIPCPACGLTRALEEMVKGNIWQAIYHNILSIPLVVCGGISTVFLIKDIILNEKKFIETIYKILNQFSIIIFMLLIFSFLINVYHGI